MKLLGIDYGRRRIGVAATDESGTLARGIGVVDRKKRPDTYAALEEIVRSEKPDALVGSYRAVPRAVRESRRRRRACTRRRGRRRRRLAPLRGASRRGRGGRSSSRSPAHRTAGSLSLLRSLYPFTPRWFINGVPRRVTHSSGCPERTGRPLASVVVERTVPVGRR